VGLSQKHLSIILTNTIMKNKTGRIIGFVAGMAGFLGLFKIIILDNTPPEDELAPGAVLILSILSGLLLGYAGNLLQNYFEKKSA
jgi:hypothetical protein